MKAPEQYLARYAEPEARLSSKLPMPAVEYCLAIPAYDEHPGFFHRLRSLLTHHRVLLIVAINQPDSIPAPTAANLSLATELRSHTEPLWRKDHLELRKVAESESYLLMIDRFKTGEKIPRKKGVGLARKIACDIAASLIREGRVLQPWIYITDADSHLPDNYFQPSLTNSSAVAFTFPFRHITNGDALGSATRLYEFSLYYYRDGLAFAGSPYAFHTLGSTLAIDANGYRKVRGFPPRSGGEDFYLLNKLAKIGTVLTPDQPIIAIEARQSHRVPFGTGPAVEKIMMLENPAEEYEVYNPQAFIYLKQLLELLPEGFQQNSEKLLRLLPPRPGKVALDMGLAQAIHQANRLSRKSGNLQQYLRHIHGWFDGFRTLKFIHRLRDQGLANVRAGDINAQLAPWLTSLAAINFN